MQVVNDRLQLPAPFPATLEEMTRPSEKKCDSGSNDFYTEIPFHKHFDKLLSIVDDD